MVRNRYVVVWILVVQFDGKHDKNEVLQKRLIPWVSQVDSTNCPHAQLGR
jgi:hypothetical protein